jgi:hypothetical protein
VEELYDYVIEALVDIKHDCHMLASFVMDAGVPLHLSYYPGMKAPQ